MRSATPARSTWTWSTPSRRGGSSTASSAISSARCLWKKVARNLSAGRVQSVAVRLIADREKRDPRVRHRGILEDHRDGEPGRLHGRGRPFEALLAEYDGAKFEAKNEADAHAIRDALASARYVVSKVEETEKLDKADAPFKTSTLQQQAAIRLRFSGKKTMKIAQELYEGIDVDGSGPVGLITYMRTDSLRVSDEAMTAVRDRIKTEFGDKYLPAKPIRYAAGKMAQEAHEAIRPTDLNLDPGARSRARLSHDQFRLYQLIYARFVASQMAPAVFTVTDVAITAGRGLFKAQGKVLKFDGHRRVWPPGGKQEDELLPPLDRSARHSTCTPSTPTQHFTQPPPRYSEATLIKALEKGGHRPARAPTRRSSRRSRTGSYVEQKERRFFATDLGMVVTDLLVKHFPKILDLKFTAHMEDELDDIATAKEDMVKVLDEFYYPFQEALKAAETQMERVQIPTNEICHVCGAPDGAQVRQDRPVPGLLEISRVQGDPAAGRPAPRRGRRERARLPEVRQAAHDPREQARREVPLVLGLSRTARNRSTSTRRASPFPRWSRPSTSARNAASRWRCGRDRADRSWAARAIPSAATRCPSTTRASRSRRSRSRSSARSAAVPMAVRRGRRGSFLGCTELSQVPRHRSGSRRPQGPARRAGAPAAARRRPT